MNKNKGDENINKLCSFLFEIFFNWHLVNMLKIIILLGKNNEIELSNLEEIMTNDVLDEDIFSECLYFCYDKNLITNIIETENYPEQYILIRLLPKGRNLYKLCCFFKIDKLYDRK